MQTSEKYLISVTTKTERISRTPPASANKDTHSGFETRRRHHQKSKT